MNWQEKLRMTCEAIKEFDRLKIAFSVAPFGADEGFRGSLRQRFPNLDEDYLNFLELTDGAQFETCVLFGSGRSGFTSLDKAFARYGQSRDALGNIPIGMNGDGNPFVMLKTGEIVLSRAGPTGLGSTIRLSPNFKELMSEFLIGNRFPEIYEKTWKTIHESEWTAYLRLRGWASFA